MSDIVPANNGRDPEPEPELLASDLVRFVIGSRGNMPLAAERASRKLGRKVTEYMLTEIITEDPDSVERIQRQLRSVQTMAMFEALDLVRVAMIGMLEHMSPGDLARLYSTLSAAFANITAPQTKVSFDLTLEAQKAAADLGLDPLEVERELKQILSKNRQSRTGS